MDDLGWSKADLRRAAKIKSFSTLSEIFTKGRTESPQLPAIASALGVEVIWLQSGRGPKFRNNEPVKTYSNIALSVAELTEQLTPADQVKLLNYLQTRIELDQKPAHLEPPVA